MPLILLWVGEEFNRFPTLEAAQKAGALAPAQDQPARIEITPDGGGPMTTYTYDSAESVWALDLTSPH